MQFVPGCGCCPGIGAPIYNIRSFHAVFENDFVLSVDSDVLGRGSSRLACKSQRCIGCIAAAVPSPCFNFSSTIFLCWDGARLFDSNFLVLRVLLVAGTMCTEACGKQG